MAKDRPISRCAVCYKIIDVQPASDIVMQDEGIRNGHYYAVYFREIARPRCAPCRHRIAAKERLIGMWQRRGDDIAMMP